MELSECGFYKPAITKGENLVFRIFTEFWLFGRGNHCPLIYDLRCAAFRALRLPHCVVVRPVKIGRPFTRSLRFAPAIAKSWVGKAGNHLLARLNETFATNVMPVLPKGLVEALNVWRVIVALIVVVVLHQPGVAVPSTTSKLILQKNIPHHPPQLHHVHV